MEDIGIDIIFYIIAGIIAIIGALGRRKRKPVQARTTDDKARTKKKFDEILEDIIRGGEGDNITQGKPDFWKTDAEETEADYEIEELVLSADNEGRYSEPMAKEFIDEGNIDEVNTFSSEGQPVTEQAVDEIGLTGTSSAGNPDSWAAELAEDFDLPQALVYSEILARKEYF